MSESKQERDSDKQLCQSLDALQETEAYKENSQQNVRQFTKDLEVKTEDLQLQAHQEQIQTNNTDIGQLVEQLDRTTRDIQSLHRDNQALQSVTEAKERQLRRLSQQLEANKETISTLQQTIRERDREVSKLRQMLTSKNENQPSQQQATPTDRKPIHITWESLPDAPIRLNSGSSAVIGNKTYFKHWSQTIHLYSSNNQWNLLPPHPLDHFTIVSLDNKLTTVGGRTGGKCSNKLYSHIKTKWTEHFPPMPTQRSTPAAVYTSNALVVAGGHNGCTNLATVEVLNARSRQWSSVSSLPFLTNQPSMKICQNHVYLYAGYGSPRQEHYSVIKCSLSGLIQSESSFTIWERITSLPVRFSSIATINSHLLAVGGKDHRNKDSKDIHQYNPITKSWQVVSQMSFARWKCLTASLPGNKLMVVGGRISYRTCSKVEIANM